MNDNDRMAFYISRRKALALLGAVGAAMLAGRANAQSDSAGVTDGKLPACIVTPQQTEGPYFVDEPAQFLSSSSLPYCYPALPTFIFGEAYSVRSSGRMPCQMRQFSSTSAARGRRE
jgi:hypothetical protein